MINSFGKNDDFGVLLERYKNGLTETVDQLYSFAIVLATTMDLELNSNKNIAVDLKSMDICYKNINNLTNKTVIDHYYTNLFNRVEVSSVNRHWKVSKKDGRLYHFEMKTSYGSTSASPTNRKFAYHIVISFMPPEESKDGVQYSQNQMMTISIPSGGEVGVDHLNQVEEFVQKCLKSK